MANVEDTQLERLESELSLARIRRVRAEHGLSVMDRQLSLAQSGKKSDKEVRRAEERLEKTRQAEADLLQKIEDVKNPKPPEETEAGAGEGDQIQQDDESAPAGAVAADEVSSPEGG